MKKKERFYIRGGIGFPGFDRIIVLTVIISTTLIISLFAGGTQESGSGRGGGTAGETELHVFVSILPQEYFVKRITGDTADVTVMVPPGRSPATYEPTPKQVTSLGSADVFFTIGVPFEQAFLPSIRENVSGLTIVDTSRRIEKRRIQSSIGETAGDHGEAEPAHEDEHFHDHEDGMPDPHIWLSPPLVKKQAETMLEALVSLAPAREETFRSNYRDFVEELEALDAELRETLEPVEGSPFFVYHPSFGYFAETYGLEQIAIELGGDEPTPKQLQKVISRAKELGVRVIFVQPEFSKASAQRVADAINGAVVEVAPLRPDYMENMRNIAEEVRDGLSGGE